MCSKEGLLIHNLAKRLWSINRSITGEGLRKTLQILKEEIPQLDIREVKSGTKVFDWTVPLEWSCKTAHIIDPNGKKICNLEDNNLHLVGYSSPINKKIKLCELQNHLHSLPDQPTAIPYVTSYYNKTWGFCISHEERMNLVEGDYKVVIESSLFQGVLNYGEVFIKGNSNKEIFLSTYVCHPSMANNELSGPTVLTHLVKWLLSQTNLGYSYRIVFIPETIGSITYLSQNYKELKKNVFAGFNISCVGDDRSYSYIPSRNGNTPSDNVARHVLKWIDSNYVAYAWSDRASDERQYCAPGIDLPVASVCRTKYHCFPEYHTSLDDLENVVTPKGLQGGYNMLKKILETIENNVIPKVNMLCEPQLGKRGLYADLSKFNIDQHQIKMIMMDFISWCDGDHTLLEISEKLNVPIWELYDLCNNLEDHEIISVNRK